MSADQPYALGRLRTSRVDPDSVDRIRRWVRLFLQLSDDATVSVNEMDCADPACPGLETVILVLREGFPTLSIKLAGSAVVQTKPAVEKAALSFMTSDNLGSTQIRQR